MCLWFLQVHLGKYPDSVIHSYICSFYKFIYDICNSSFIVFGFRKKMLKFPPREPLPRWLWLALNNAAYEAIEKIKSSLVKYDWADDHVKFGNALTATFSLRRAELGGAENSLNPGDGSFIYQNPILGEDEEWVQVKKTFVLALKMGADPEKPVAYSATSLIVDILNPVGVVKSQDARLRSVVELGGKSTLDILMELVTLCKIDADSTAKAMRCRLEELVKACMDHLHQKYEGYFGSSISKDIQIVEVPQYVMQNWEQALSSRCIQNVAFRCINTDFQGYCDIPTWECVLVRTCPVLGAMLGSSMQESVATIRSAEPNSKNSNSMGTSASSLEANVPCKIVKVGDHPVVVCGFVQVATEGRLHIDRLEALAAKLVRVSTGSRGSMDKKTGSVNKDERVGDENVSDALAGESGDSVKSGSVGSRPPCDLGCNMPSMVEMLVGILDFAERYMCTVVSDVVQQFLINQITRVRLGEVNARLPTSSVLDPPDFGSQNFIEVEIIGENAGNFDSILSVCLRLRLDALKGALLMLASEQVDIQNAWRAGLLTGEVDLELQASMMASSEDESHALGPPNKRQRLI